MSGFIPQITTRVLVKSDTKGLDDAIKLIEGDSIISHCFSEVKADLLEKKKIAEDVDPLASKIAQRLQDNQSQRIRAFHRFTGMMANSVDITRDGDAQYLIGNTATSVDGFPYPLAIETGRREVTPLKSDGWLRWWTGAWFSGDMVFAKRSKATKGDPYVEDSIKMTDRQVDKIVDSFLQTLEK